MVRERRRNLGIFPFVGKQVLEVSLGERKQMFEGKLKKIEITSQCFKLELLFETAPKLVRVRAEGVHWSSFDFISFHGILFRCYKALCRCNSPRPGKVALSNLASPLGFLSEFVGSTWTLMILYKVMKFIDNDSMCDKETYI